MRFRIQYLISLTLMFALGLGLDYWHINENKITITVYKVK